MQRAPTIAVVTRETRLQGLLARWGTRGAAKFRLTAAHAHEQERSGGKPMPSRGKVSSRSSSASSSNKAPPPNSISSTMQAAAEFDDYELEDDTYRGTLQRLQQEVEVGLPISYVQRSYLPTYDFRACVAVVVVGQDGLVANVAKYVGDVPIIAVNPDPARFDGVLLPFQAGQVRGALERVLAGKATMRDVTLAEASLNDGQRLLAFNDLFVGCKSHVSARYTINVANKAEMHSSSGMIVSTGAGSTGWLSSMFNMLAGFQRWLNAEPSPPLRLEWNDPRLAWVVREPFVSKQSSAELVAGLLNDGQELVVESLMPNQGVIFSDGVESDFLEFNSGAIVRIRRAAQQAKLVV